jgi:two-component system nitrogen regulation response regulator NtrX
MTAKILIVDDEEDIRALIRGILEDEGYVVEEAANSTSAFTAIREQAPDLMVLDIWLQGSEKDGMEILDALQADETYLPVLMISGHGTIETAVKAIKNGAYDFIEKPFKSDRLLLMIARALETARLKQENRLLKTRSDNQEHQLIGDSGALRALRQQVEKIAPTNSRVMITGEAGTGKEVVARTIHRQSARKDQAFTAINCAVLHPERLEEELFGIDKGANRKTGLLENTNGGTLFLDEVVDMPLETQGKILRFLQENKFFPVGSTQARSVDVRVISSTNQDLDEAVKEGRFREDLLYRLNVVTLDVPPLTARKDDILPLAKHFMAVFAQQTGQEVEGFTREAEMALKTCPWPGNVRQLKNVMEWIMIMNNFSACTHIEKSHLPPQVIGISSSAASNENVGDYLSFPLREARENFEKEYLSQQVQRFNGNISQTAEFIGMERSALHRKLKSLEISLSDAQDSGKSGNEIPPRKTA